jgi:outer membrane receptor for monomeric catechols
VGSRTTLNAGMRFDSMSYDRETSGDASESTLTPRLGISYAPDSRTAWKANWGMYSKFVPANSVETSYFGAAPSDIGETNAQESSTGEVSFEKQVSDSVAYRITPFYSNYRHLGDMVTDDNGVTTYRTIGKGEARGVEFNLRKKLSAGWQGWVSYTYQTIKAGDGPGPMDYTAWDQRNTLCVVADYTRGIWGHTLRTDFGSGRQDDSASAGISRHANPSAVFTYTLSANLPKGSSLGDSLSLSIYNVFNNRQAAQYTYGPARTGYSFVPDRCISLGLNKAF